MIQSDSDPDQIDYIRLSDDWNVLLVDNDNALQQAWEIAEDTYVCALDAEWEPYTPKPCASLVQAAVRTRSNAHRHVLLLDFQAVHKQELRRLLQRIFRDRGMLKVGYGLVMDLRAIAAGLGGEGAGCVSVVDPFVDVGSLHRALFAGGSPGVAKVEGKGLAGLVQAQLGQRLDKRLQCSSWSQRPLLPEQVAYAALDAAVLLLLLNSFINTAALPPPAPRAGADDVPSEGASAGGRDGGAAEQPSTVGSGTRKDNQENVRSRTGRVESNGEELNEADAPQSTMPSAMSGAALNSSDDSQKASELADEFLASCLVREGQQNRSACAANAHSPAASPSLGGQSDTATESPTERCGSAGSEASMGLGSLAQEAVQRAAAAWGSRLEVGGSVQKPKKDKTPGAKKLTPAQPGEEFGWPVVIPWQATGSEPRFACDVMTEGLARQLRLCGLDATSAPEFGKNERFKAYRHLVSSAEAEGRVILTADATFLRAGYTDRGYLVRANSKREQLAEVLTAFSIKVEEDDLLSRCTRCNGTFIPRALTWAELPPTCKVSQSVESKHSEFWMCSNESCQKVYWQGFQYGNAMENLTRRILGSFA